MNEAVQRVFTIDHFLSPSAVCFNKCGHMFVVDSEVHVILGFKEWKQPNCNVDVFLAMFVSVAQLMGQDCLHSEFSPWNCIFQQQLAIL